MKTHPRSYPASPWLVSLIAVIGFPTGFLLPHVVAAYWPRHAESPADTVSPAPLRDPLPSPEKITPNTRAQDNPPTAAGIPWPTEAGGADFVRFCRARARENPEEFAAALRKRMSSLSVQDIEAAVWALSQNRPDLGAAVTAESKSPWLCKKLADSITAGVPPGDETMLKQVMDTLKLPASFRNQLAVSATRDHAESDPAWALRKLSDGAGPWETFSILRGLARKDPVKALEEGKNRGLHSFGMAQLLSEAAKTHPQDMLRIAGTQSEPAASAIFLKELLSGNPQQYGEAEMKTITAMVEQYGDTAVAGPYHGTAIRGELVKNLLPRDTPEALRQFEKLTDQQRSIQMSSVALAANGQDWNKALNWVKTTQQDSSISELLLYNGFAHDWARAEPEILEQALINDPNLPARARFLEVLHAQNLQKGTKSYQEWVRKIPPSLKSPDGK